MAYVSPVSRSTGDIITAAIWNQDVVENVLAGASEIAESVGDLIVGAGEHELTRLAPGTGGTLLRRKVSEAGLEWAVPADALQTFGLVAAGRLTAAATTVTLQGFGSYRRLRLVLFGVVGNTTHSLRLNNNTTANQHAYQDQDSSGWATAAGTSFPLKNTGAGVMESVVDIVSDGVTARNQAVVVRSAVAGTGYLLFGQHEGTATYVTRLDLLAGATDGWSIGTHYALYGSDAIALPS